MPALNSVSLVADAHHVADTWFHSLAERDGGVTVADLAVERVPMRLYTTGEAVHAAFVADADLRSVLVRIEANFGVLLVNRRAFYQAFTGPLGFGRALHERRPVEGWLRGDTTVLSADTPAHEAGAGILGQFSTVGHQADDEVIVVWSDGRVGTVGVDVLFAELNRYHLRQVRRLDLGERRFRSLVQSSSDVIVVLGADASICYVSPSADRITGRSADDRIGGNPFSMIHPDDVVLLEELLKRSLAEPTNELCAEFRMQIADGTWRRFELNGRNLLDDPAVAGIVVNYRDVTERRELEDQLRHQAFHDPLTGLANRALLADRIDHAIQRMRRPSVVPSALMVLYCDLDGFKAVNDTFGHAVGDELLVQVSARMRTCLRAQDTLARLGGDEFAVLLEEVTEKEDREDIAQRLLVALQAPFLVQGHQIYANASIGVTINRSSDADAEELLRQADVAMYTAKNRGKNRHERYDATMRGSTIKDHELVGDLRQALRDAELNLHYQPLVDVPTGRLVGVEALVRWRHPERGDVEPSTFIPVAEKSGLIIELGRWVLEEACRQAATWARRFPSTPPLTMSVNLSARQLAQPNLAEDVTAVLTSTGLPAAALQLEITETALIENLEVARTTLAQLKALGVRLAIDDFGTGYSSLSQLRQLPVDTVKLDKSFIDRLGHTQEDSDLVEGVIRLAHVLALDVTAEGIEYPDQLTRLDAMACDRGQGYHFSRPLPAADIAALLASTAAPHAGASSIAHATWQPEPSPRWPSDTANTAPSPSPCALQPAAHGQ